MKSIVIKATFALLVIVFGVFASTFVSPAGASQDSAVVPGRILIRPAASAKAEVLAVDLRHLSMEVQETSSIYGKRYSHDKAEGQSVKNALWIVSIPNDADPRVAADQVARMPMVASASPDFIRPLLFAPDDPFYRDGQQNFRQIGMERVWNVTFGGDVLVAVLDTGYRFGDLNDSALNLVDGYDFWGQDEDPTDFVGHGTLVTNVIAEATDNGIGVAGMAPGVTIMPLKVFPDEQGGAEDSDIIEALNYAVLNGAQVINMSFGGGDHSEVFHLALKDAYEAGVFLVGATGNDGEEELARPSNYDEVFAVGSCNQHPFGYEPTRSGFSNFGQGLDLVAPGDSIVQESYTPDSGISYYAASGTSMSAPHVTAAAALMITLGGPSDPATLAQTLRDSAFGTDGVWDNEVGFGELDVNAAISLYYEPLPNGPPVAHAEVFSDSPYAPAWVTFSALQSQDPDGNIVDYAWQIEKIGEKVGEVVEMEITEPGTYDVTLTLVDAEGESDQATTRFEIPKKSVREEEQGGGCGCTAGNTPHVDLSMLVLILMTFGLLFRKPVKARYSALKRRF